MKQVKLTNGGYALVDDEDFELVNSITWQNNGVGYATHSTTGKTIRMHRLIMGVTSSQVHVDHINGNRLDNRRANLRLCNVSQNHANMKKQANRSSQYKGVSWDKYSKSWKAKVRCNYTIYNIGRYKDEKDAALAYDAKAVELFGDFAKINFPNS